MSHPDDSEVVATEAEQLVERVAARLQGEATAEFWKGLRGTAPEMSSEEAFHITVSWLESYMEWFI